MFIFTESSQILRSFKNVSVQCGHRMIKNILMKTCEKYFVVSIKTQLVNVSLYKRFTTVSISELKVATNLEKKIGESWIRIFLMRPTSVGLRVLLISNPRQQVCWPQWAVLVACYKVLALPPPPWLASQEAPPLLPPILLHTPWPTPSTCVSSAVTEQVENIMVSTLVRAAR